jgi:hypothetical protein
MDKDMFKPNGGHTDGKISQLYFQEELNTYI